VAPPAPRVGRYWKNEDGDVYATRHRCVRHRVIVRFYSVV
jgi:hypothetical protein